MADFAVVDMERLVKELVVTVRIHKLQRARWRVRLARILFDLGKRIGGFSAVTYARERRAE